MRRDLCLALPLLLATTALPHQAGAQPAADRIDAIERQIRALQTELRRVKSDLASRSREVDAARAAAARADETAAMVRAAQASPAARAEVVPPGYALVRSPDSGQLVMERISLEPPRPPLKQGQFRVGDVTITLGGYADLTAIYRSRNEVADISSNLNTGIPLRNSPNYHQGEFRETARATRISGLVEANPDAVTKLTAYTEIDFQAGPPTANSNQTNSYSPRIRQAFATYDRSDLGLEILGGQAWSLLTLYQGDITGRNEAIPLTIDSAYNAGFTWTRQPQFRVAKSFDNKLFWLALSAENPQTVFYTGPNGLAPSTVGTINVNNPGGSGFPSTTNYSTNIAPDLIAKAAFNPRIGSFQVYGVGTIEHDRVSLPGTGTSNTHFAGGAGAGAFIHVIPNPDPKGKALLDFRVSGLAGEGIGRYGSAQLPDAIVSSTGTPVPIPEWMAFVGVEGHPTPDFDLFGYLGTERESARYFEVKGKGYGYGSPLYPNTTCDIELGSSTGCVGNTSGVTEGTVGGYWKFLHGPFGTMQAGVSYSYIYRSIFQGSGNVRTPHTDQNQVLLSFRYYPFQK